MAYALASTASAKAGLVDFKASRSIVKLPLKQGKTISHQNFVTAFLQCYLKVKHVIKITTIKYLCYV